MIDAKYLLTDDAMRDFILNGYVTVKPDLPAATFAEAHQQAAAAAQQGPLAKNILSQVPALATLLNHPTVRGAALTSILGPNHHDWDHYCHNMPAPPAGVAPGWHRTDEFAYHRDPDSGPAKHRCRTVMSIFYPHDCTPDMGPTAITPGSHYYTRTASAACHEGFQTAGPVGAITFVHFDLWHTATCNYSDKMRYMMKFSFSRTEEPTAPTWNCKDTNWKPVERGPSGYDHNDMWECMWNWNCGRPGFTGAARLSGQRSGIKDIPRLIASLRDDDETVGLQSAYALARIGEPAMAALFEKLIEESAAAPNDLLYGRSPRKGGAGGKPCDLCYSGYALAAIGAAAIPELTRLLGHTQWWVRGAAADVLREMGRPGLAAAEALARALGDEHPRVRRLAAEALATIAPASTHVVRALAERLSDEDRGVRLAVATALLNIRPTPEFAVPNLVKALGDEDLYTRSYIAATLERIGSQEARRAVTEFRAARPDAACLVA